MSCPRHSKINFVLAQTAPNVAMLPPPTPPPNLHSAQKDKEGLGLLGVGWGSCAWSRLRFTLLGSGVSCPQVGAKFLDCCPLCWRSAHPQTAESTGGWTAWQRRTKILQWGLAVSTRDWGAGISGESEAEDPTCQLQKNRKGIHV